MNDTALPTDPLWPRAAHWIVPAPAEKTPCDLALLGVPAHATSITPTGAHATPAAVREALRYYSTYAASRRIDVASLAAHDFGDVDTPDGPEGEARVAEAARRALEASPQLLLAIGGDNSITYSLARAVAEAAVAAPTGLTGGAGAADGAATGLADLGLITIDAHHDLRDGTTNGSPVRRLLEAGMPGANIVQLGIADFSNSAAYAARALEHGITVIHRSEFAHRPLAELLGYALGRAGAGGRRIFVDVDVDACDRAEVPACPSAAPGGFSAAELREMVFALASDPRVSGLDITEIDATIDAHDRRTVRLAALIVLEAAAGVAARRR